MQKESMQKLRDAKNITWKEFYTDKTSFLKDQFDAVVGKGAYRRWEGKEVDGPGEWYVIVSPAGVKEHRRAQFFAGIRKVPDTYPAGGKYFDTFAEAMNYAHETWGVPRPSKMPVYNAGDLQGISKRIEEWKAKRDKEKESHGDEKTSSVTITRIKREAMALGNIYKDDIELPFALFLPFLRDPSFNPEDPGASDRLYHSILMAAGFSSPQDVVALIDAAPSTSGRDRDHENDILASGEFSVDAIFPEGQLDTSTGLKAAAIIMTIGRQKRANLYAQFGVTPYDPRLSRSNFEEALFTAYYQYMRNVENLNQNYDFTHFLYDRFMELHDEDVSFSEFAARLSDPEFKQRWGQLPEEEMPIEFVMTYGTRDSVSRYWAVTPYLSRKKYSPHYTVEEDVFAVDEMTGWDPIDKSFVYGVANIDVMAEDATEEQIAQAGQIIEQYANVIGQIKYYLRYGTVVGSGRSSQIMGRQMRPSTFKVVARQITSMCRQANVPHPSKVSSAVQNACLGWVNYRSRGPRRDRVQHHVQNTLARGSGAYWTGNHTISDLAGLQSVHEFIKTPDVMTVGIQTDPQSLIDGLLSLYAGESDSADVAEIQDAINRDLSSEERQQGARRAIQILSSLPSNSVVNFEQFIQILGDAGMGNVISPSRAAVLFSSASETISTVLLWKKIRHFKGTSFTAAKNANPELQDENSPEAEQARELWDDVNARMKNALYEAARHDAYERYAADHPDDRMSEEDFNRNIHAGARRPEFIALYLQYADAIPTAVAMRIINNAAVEYGGRTYALVPATKLNDVIKRIKLDSASSVQTSARSLSGLLDSSYIDWTLMPNLQGIRMARLKPTDYGLYRVQKFRIKHEMGLYANQPEVYEDILLTCFVPNDPEVVSQVRQVIDTTPALPENASVELRREHCIRRIDAIESILNRYFSDDEARGSYTLHSSYARPNAEPINGSNVGRVFVPGRTVDTWALTALEQRIAVALFRQWVENPESYLPGVTKVWDDLPQKLKETFRNGVENVFHGLDEIGFPKYPDVNKKSERLGILYANLVAGAEKAKVQTGTSRRLFKPAYHKTKWSGAQSPQSDLLSTKSIGYKTSVKLEETNVEEGEGRRREGTPFYTAALMENDANFTMANNGNFLEMCRIMGAGNGYPVYFKTLAEYMELNDIPRGRISNLHLSLGLMMGTHALTPQEAEDQYVVAQRAFNQFSTPKHEIRLRLSEEAPNRSGSAPTKFDLQIKAGTGTTPAEPWYYYLTAPDLNVDNPDLKRVAEQRAEAALSLMTYHVLSMLVYLSSGRSGPDVPDPDDPEEFAQIFGGDVDFARRLLFSTVPELAQARRTVEDVTEQVAPEATGGLEESEEAAAEEAAEVPDQAERSVPEIEQSSPDIEDDVDLEEPEVSEDELPAMEPVTPEPPAEEEQEIGPSMVERVPPRIPGDFSGLDLSRPEEVSPVQRTPPRPLTTQAPDQEEEEGEEEEEQPSSSRRSPPHGGLGFNFRAERELPRTLVLGGTPQSLNRLAALYRDKGNLIVASYLSAQSQKLAKTGEFKRIVSNTLRTLTNIACDFAKRGKIKEAAELNLIVRKHLSKMREQE